jgi:MFS-type transporter involved in bile tolerance (Atg22 family)
MTLSLVALFACVFLGLVTTRLDWRAYAAIITLAVFVTSLYLYAPWLM